MTTKEIQQEALTKAMTGQSWSNYPLIIAGFVKKGIPEDQIRPRENVFSFHAWKALGKHVKKGEHGVKILTYIETEKQIEKPDGTKDLKISRRPWYVTVFHESQVA